MSDELATNISAIILFSNYNGNSSECVRGVHYVVDVKSQLRKQLRLARMYQGYNEFLRKKWDDLLREDEEMQRTHRPITGRAKLQ